MTRPLLICDADEVLLNFFGPFETYIGELGYSLRLDSFALGGNIRDANGVAMDKEAVSTLIDRFFLDRVEACTPVDGAVDALAQVSALADIVILTNVPEHARDRRAAMLRACGMDFPVIANAGGKGPAVVGLIGERRLPVLFIDDLPHQHASVARHAPQVQRLHFIADERLRPLIPAAADAHWRIDGWTQALPHVLDTLGRAG